MSMHCYPVMDYGIVMDQKIIVALARHLLKHTNVEMDMSKEDIDFLLSDDFSIDDERINNVSIDYTDFLNDEVDKLMLFSIYSFFDGEARSFEEVDKFYGISEEDGFYETFDESDVLFISAKKEMSLFSTAYVSPLDLVNEFKETFANIEGMDKIDIPSRLCMLSGVTNN